ncbi:MAG: HD domain-containing phosphohydrolase [Vulcanimicrobiota bacterium]
MTNGLIHRFHLHVQAGRLMDLVEDLEKSKIRLTVRENGLKTSGPPGLLSPELSQLLESSRDELIIVLRMASLATDQFGSTRLYHAVLTEDLPEVQRHLANGARPDSENRLGVTPFHAAVRTGNKPIIQTLAAAGANFEKPDIDGRTPLHIAVENDDLEVVKFLLLNGASPNTGDFFGLTPLARAVGRDQKESGQVLVEFGAEMEDSSLTQKEKDFYQLVLRMLQGYSDALYQHSLRVADIARCFARDLELSENEIKSVRIGGLLHDLGKVSLPDDIFDKADDLLSDEEVDMLIGHPEDGAQAIPKFVVPDGITIHPIILSHHEKWDGSGFPHGLAENNIPLLAQLVGLADYYDHLVTHRPYDPAISHSQALEHLNEQAGSHFSEEMIDCLYRVQDLLPFYSG